MEYKRHLEIVTLSCVIIYVSANPFSSDSPWHGTCSHQSGTLLGRDSDEDDPVNGKIEDGWPMPLRLLCYLAGLFYSFYAVGMISDIFMQGIDKITSKKVRRIDKATGRTTTAYVWNATIANLSLMALGSSAPEIMMGCFEVVLGDYMLGPLGPGVIVGSAAFNLMVISAVCVNAHVDNKVTKIKEVPVYMITAFFSVFAYLWLFFIILILSPDVIDMVEAVMTILFFPLLLFLAYLADIGQIKFAFLGLQDEGPQKEELPLLEDATKEELAAIEFKIRQEHGQHLTEEQVISFMKAQYCTRRNKAFYAQVGLQKAYNNKKLDLDTVVPIGSEAAEDVEIASPVTMPRGTSDVIEDEIAQRTIIFSFASETYACLESARVARIKVYRGGPISYAASVKYRTVEGTGAQAATEGQDYAKTEGSLFFDKDVTEMEVTIEIMNDSSYEEDEYFQVELYEPKLEDTNAHATFQAGLGDVPKTTMTIIDDDLPGKLRFKEEEKKVEGKDQDYEIYITVERFDGSSGTISCTYETEDCKGAIAGVDYEAVQGKVEMPDGVTSFQIAVTIKASGRYNTNATFQVKLTEPKSGEAAASGKVGFDHKTDGGEDSCLCTIEIVGKPNESRDKLLSRMKSKLHGSKVAHQRYAEQFKDALFKIMDDDDEDDDGGEDAEAAAEKKPGPMDYFWYFVGLPWKLLFATVPPTDYCGGWLTFFAALFFIGLVTIVVGDLANLVGCAMDIPAEITAITFVALGTSLPDTFASKTAAEMDPYADNSIGNVTGSNSVNVFLGCGLAWTMGAAFWTMTPLDQSAEVMAMAYRGESSDIAFFKNDDSMQSNWLFSFAGMETSVKDHVLTSLGCEKNEACKASSLKFMVPAGSLAINLAVFSINAFIAILHLYQRRVKWGGELGGPKKGFLGQYFSGACLVCQWFSYILVSSIWCLKELGRFD